MKIAFAGDSHGYTDYMSLVFKAATENHCDVVFQVGDFGLSGQRWYDQCSRDVATWGLPLVFIDGNHDHHDWLETFKTEIFNLGFGKFEAAEVAPGVYHIPRGTAFEWGDEFNTKKFLAIGGAFSIDKAWRVEDDLMSGNRRQWFPQELITFEQAEKAKSVGKVDVMVCHDAPHFVDLSLPMGGYPYFPQTVANRQFLQEIYEACQPDLIIHGHWHYYHDEVYSTPYEKDGKLEWKTTRVIGLDCNFAPIIKSVRIYDI